MRKDGLEYIVPVPIDRYNDVITHLRNNFFWEEPLVLSLQLCNKGESHQELEHLATDTLQDQYSILVVEPSSNKIAGVLLNKGVFKSDLEKDVQKLDQMTDAKFRQIFTLIYNKNMQHNVFEKYNVDKLFELRMASVDEEFRNRGIARKMMELSEEIAKKNGFKLMKGDATNFYTQKALLRLGWEKCYEVEYKDYKNSDGNVVFNTIDPHTSFSIMAKAI